MLILSPGSMKPFDFLLQSTKVHKSGRRKIDDIRLLEQFSATGVWVARSITMAESLDCSTSSPTRGLSSAVKESKGRLPPQRIRYYSAMKDQNNDVLNARARCPSGKACHVNPLDQVIAPQVAVLSISQRSTRSFQRFSSLSKRTSRILSFAEYLDKGIAGLYLGVDV